MEKLTGYLSVTTEAEQAIDKEILVAEINRVIKPPRPLTYDQIYIGILWAASNSVNLQGGCFESGELETLAQLVVDAPVMIGHNKQELPIGRIFKGEVVNQKGAPWLKAWFYWHRDQDKADSLKAAIDAGIYKECSLGFLYEKPECCICRQDMRHCRHRVNEVVRLGGKEIRAFYFYKQIRKVLEVSLVYRGAVEGSRVSSLDVTGLTAPCAFWFYLNDNADGIIHLQHASGNTRLKISHINLPLLYRGRKFWCEVQGEEVNQLQRSNDLKIVDRGKMVEFAPSHDGAMVLKLQGKSLQGTFTIEPGRFGQSTKYLFSLAS